MRIWADIYDASGNRLGAGPIHTLTSATVARKLDGAGSISFDVPGGDTRALDLIQPKRRARLWVLDEDGRQPRELGRMIIEGIGARAGSSGWSRSADGPDDLGELKFASVLRGRRYDAQTVNAIVDDLLGLATGWSRSGSVSTLVSARYDGVSVLRALQSLAQQQGIHLRRGANAGTLEIGAFGADSGLRVVNAAYLHPDIYDNDEALLIDQLQLVESSEELVNWLAPYGAGRGDAMLTLERSTRSIANGDPYDVQSMTGPDGQTIYYLSDAASIASYGQVQKVGTFKEIGPISNSAADQIAAANALYDAAASWLQRYRSPYTSYAVRVKKLRVALMPGDRINLRYTGVITDEAGNMVDFQAINGDFWVLEVREGYGVSGASISLKIASVDRYEQSEAQVVLGALEEIRIGNVSVEPYFSKASYVYRREIAPSFSAVVPLVITNATAQLTRCYLRVRSRPFRSTSQGAAAGGDHRHRIAFFVQRTSAASPLYLYTYAFGRVNPADPTPNYMALTHPNSPHAPIQEDLYTYDSSGTHTHTPIYGISDDTQYPVTISIAINGTDRTAALGGPWQTTSGAADFTLEISEFINQAATLQQLHTITFTCATGRGEIEVTVEPYEVIQSIAVF